MNWYMMAKMAAPQVMPFDPEDDMMDDPPGMDRWDAANQADDAFHASGIRPKRSSRVSHIAIEDGRVIGAVSSEWSKSEEVLDEGENREVWVFSFDVAVRPEFRGFPKTGLKLIEQGIKKYESEKHMYEEMGGLTMMRLWVVNPKLVPYLERTYNFIVESSHYDGAAHLIRY